MNPDDAVPKLSSRREEIEHLVYFLWQNAGEPSGTADRDWFLAEHVIETGPINPSNPQNDISGTMPSQYGRRS